MGFNESILNLNYSCIQKGSFKFALGRVLQISQQEPPNCHDNPSKPEELRSQFKPTLHPTQGSWLKNSKFSNTSMYTHCNPFDRTTKFDIYDTIR